MTTQDEPSNEIAITDSIAEAGRKLFAVQLQKMLKYEDGSRTGEDIESVHQMRVAIRRMRSLFQLIGEVYQAKAVGKYQRGLRDIARALGKIRDLDVMILDLQVFQEMQPPEAQSHITAMIEKLDKKRRKHRKKLNKLFDSSDYKRFVRKFRKFVETVGRDVQGIADSTIPHQVRHVLPVILHLRLADVRAYDVVLADADDEILHDLRVQYKQLRYAVEFFKPVLGSSIDGFITDVKAMQDILGRMNDIHVFTERIGQIKHLTDEQQDTVQAYVEKRRSELVGLQSQFAEQWDTFNQRTNQRQFSDALLVLR